MTLRKVFFVILIWSVMLIAAEFAWRTYLYSTGHGFFDDPNKFTSPFFTAYDEPPPVKWGTTAWYRNGEVQFTKSRNEIRIICFGGSTTVNFRAGVSYPELIERRLAGKYPDYAIRVLNAGAEGYSTAHMLVNLSLRNLELQPDIVTVYENINDLSAKDFGDRITSDYANKYKSDFYLDFRHRTGLIAELTKISRLARAVFSNINIIAFPNAEYGGAPKSVHRDYRPGLQYFVFNLRSIAAIAEGHGIRVLMASQAARDDLRRNEGFAAYNETVRAVARERGAVFVDVAAAVTDDDMFLPDAIHNTRKGVERVAEALYGPLERLVEEVIRERKRKKD
jgi:lysophospholipase L1-like esterase